MSVSHGGRGCCSHSRRDFLKMGGAAVGG
ncbi:MAG: hypothetical protein QOI59_5493, partial [Gammaproteobacteria bacterium]|nr:hypothetical protein [Gammaproteobacteria bacterium]